MTSRGHLRAAAAGFTLIEILVVLTIIAAIIGIAVPIYTSVQDNKNVTLCKTRLKSIGGSMELFYQRRKFYPKTSSGLQFLLAPLKIEVIDKTEKAITNTYICPGDDDARGAIAGNVMEAYADLDNIEPDVVSYAGRNTKEFPLKRKHAGKEVIACDAGGADGSVFIHRSKVNILFLDQSVSDLDVLDLPEGKEENFGVGTNAPPPPENRQELDLKKLNKDT
jgi:prepilin-type N-terminal cleavage/methylation domain-containing protein